MDTKRMIVGMALALALLLGWHFFVYELAKRNNWELNPAPAPTSQPAAIAPTATATPTVVPGIATSQSVEAPVAPKAVTVLGSGEIRDLVLGSTARNDTQYAIGLEVSNRGAAITKATLNRFKREPVGDENPKKVTEPFVFQQPQRAAGHAALATRAIIIGGQRIDLEGQTWRVEKNDRRQAELSLDVTGNDKVPLVRLRKVFEVPSRLTADGKDVTPQGGYEVLVRQTVENLSSSLIKVQIEFNGPTAPPRETDRGADLQVIAGYATGLSTKYPTIEPLNYAVGSFKAGESKDIAKNPSGKDTPFVWAGLSSTYFNALVLPISSDGKPLNQIQSVKADLLNAQDPPLDHVAGLVFTTSELAIPPAASKDADLRVFLGPKSREVLKDDYYSAFPRMYAVTLAVTGGCSWCTFQFLIDALVWLLDIFHVVLRDWGLSIIALVILVRGLLHPITKRSTMNMAKMGKLGPEMERLKKKYGDNKEELNRAMMQFYKEHGATPIMGCLPMFLQMPIWIALWSSLQSTFELRQAPFLWGMTWISDLAKPDHLFYFPSHAINLMVFQVDALNLLPLLMGVVFFLQQKYTPKPAAATPEQEQQQKMMQWMTLLFPLMLYNGPSGLNLYILTSTTIGIIESKRIRDHITAKEAADGAKGPVIIDVQASRVSSSRSDRPAGGLAGLLGKAQQWAEDVRKTKDGRKKK